MLFSFYTFYQASRIIIKIRLQSISSQDKIGLIMLPIVASARRLSPLKCPHRISRDTRRKSASVCVKWIRCLLFLSGRDGWRTDAGPPATSSKISRVTYDVCQAWRRLQTIPPGGSRTLWTSCASRGLAIMIPRIRDRYFLCVTL